MAGSQTDNQIGDEAVDLTAALAAETTALKSFTDPLSLAAVPGRLNLQARFKQAPEDFLVTELSDVVLSGQGEHCWLRVRKTGQNTAWVARQLAEFAGVESQSVGYAGLKDRHAVTEQYFSVWLPGRDDPDWAAFDVAGVEIIEAKRHSSKLRRGELTGNSFRIVLRDVRGDICSDATALTGRLEQIAATGVPNYFGSQRFGIDGGNLDLFAALGRGARLSRNKKSFALSAARSALFNAYLNRRVADGTWNQCLPEDVALSDRDGDLAAMCGTGITPAAALPTGALPGTGGGRNGAGEADCLAGYSQTLALLERLQVKQHRRSLWLPVAGLEFTVAKDEITLQFALPPGCFATAVLAALADAIS